MTYSAHIEVFEYKLYCPIHVVQKVFTKVRVYGQITSFISRTYIPSKSYKNAAYKPLSAFP